ncbi:2-succinyl-5-enolpyruvyl-6-hydroxy-3-cyclohexene-1-carboxylic-acid synthase [Dyadobacter tibetensis]|uniref:2-succinyl-5-enolpyruvyl-6-hydroxy-3- cyclohexene-1-carboxylic-acid synthase n=1 Tax=Dyadobacter tibetensis TaxID=1211851 RepID=UPI0004705690|nr:2-succinyl-5-enolpyruvyl-6-hydroxy-3-cyclohexene-1-carboxylic-acid synthase [Dyadobacter tibetensis]
MAILQPLIDLAELFFQHGLRHVVLSPGSRSAALSLAFIRHGGFKIQVLIDERSAAFVGLGIAQQLQQPTILICTSGSAAYNFAPAIAEAFFQQVPLLVLTADRPKEWIHQYDGQTIFQQGIFGKHVKADFEFPADYSHPDAVWHINRTANEAFLRATTEPYGPVHINVPIREPFYPEPGETWKASRQIRKIGQIKTNIELNITQWHSLLDTWDSYDRILIAIGQQPWNNTNWDSLANLASDLAIPIVADITANINLPEHVVRHHDLFLGITRDERLLPELLITTGMSFVSKSLKLFLRENPAVVHWHIGTDGSIADPLQSLSQIIPVSPTYFFDILYEKIDFQNFVENQEPDGREAYFALWEDYDMKSRILLHRYLKKIETLNDLTALDLILSRLGSHYILQVGNSMPIRYVNALSIENIDTARVYANRGTSGIDGCLSTAIGAALATDLPVYLVLGDLSFLYDRNGLLIKELPVNLKIIILNNGGGDIFTMIDGPGRLSENATYFRNTHPYTAENTAKDAGITYIAASNIGELEQGFDSIKRLPNCALLEVFTDSADNQAAWKGLRAFMKAHLSV